MFPLPRLSKYMIYIPRFPVTIKGVFLLLVPSLLKKYTVCALLPKDTNTTKVKEMKRSNWSVYSSWAYEPCYIHLLYLSKSLIRNI